MNTNVTIGILLADDHKIVREGLRALLETQARFEVLGEADNGRTIIELARKLKPDVVIMDVAMPDLNGINATEQLTLELPEIKVIGLSMHFDKRYVSRMLNAGAYGYLRKACASEELIRAIQTVMNNRYYISDGTSSITVKEKEQYLHSDAAVDLSVLTPKEREVLQLVAEGKLTKEIALLLNASIKTVEKHRTTIMEKLKLHSIADLTKYALREGLTSLDE